jgi:alpha-ketoglutarate-dependent taurine dioxygenase
MVTLTRPRIEPLDATLGAVVTDADLANLDDPTWRIIEGAFHRYGLLVFPGQHISPEAQAAFGARFGELEQLVPGRTAVPVTNQNRDGTLMADDAFVMKIQEGNEGWHTDSSYVPVSAKASILCAHIVVSHGGQTEWADMRAAYDALDEATRKKVDGLSAYHSIRHSQAEIGHEAGPTKSYGFSDDEPPLRPLVKVHPATGRKSLFIGRHAFGIPGMDEADSKAFLDDLTAFACQAPRTYEHQWSKGDVVAWDNRCLLHRARGYDHREPRTLWHVRISGDPVTERASNK